LLCTYLSAVLLVGLVANSALGWWWADPVAALVIAAVAVKEGREAWRGEACCTPAVALIDEQADTDTCTDDCCATKG
jgi:divalent metal cation (Fe/Co/Zn/Cd) transporter